MHYSTFCDYLKTFLSIPPFGQNFVFYCCGMEEPYVVVTEVKVSLWCRIKCLKQKDLCSCNFICEANFLV